MQEVHMFDLMVSCGLASAVFLRYLRDPIRVPRIENHVPRISENYHRVPRIREIGSLQVHTGYLTFSLETNLS